MEIIAIIWVSIAFVLWFKIVMENVGEVLIFYTKPPVIPQVISPWVWPILLVIPSLAWPAYIYFKVTNHPKVTY